MIGCRRLLWATSGLLPGYLRTATPSTTRLTGRHRWLRSTPDARQSEHTDAFIMAHEADRDVGEASMTLNWVNWSVFRSRSSMDFISATTSPPHQRTPGSMSGMRFERAHIYADEGAVYVAMTRGREANIAHLVAEDLEDADSSGPSRSPATAPTSAPRIPPDSPPKRPPSASPMLNRGTSTITTTRHLSLAGGPSPFQPSRAVPGPARASVFEPGRLPGVSVERGPSLVDERRERLLPSG